ncbi:broad specificity phosphatase PhoE [Lewinella aquimaris]|uniref:Broad specificity phosphatase PhoE n=1 Tax=Neolewinella aquimaris TaxID=1835722 RepID=A0A840E379_9BACT|nr:phosphoglycerate mutase family protein [Neolewinella aquimaris]MBB4078192.1 broad specificity phosphatase PhoE [Neolewinella aquimaris]
MNSVLPLLLTILLAYACDPAAREAKRAAAREQVTTFILVRHAEKGFGDDPNLTPQGQERAQRLSEMLSTEAIDRVYTTDTKRTRQTAQPTADAHGLKVNFYKTEDLPSFASRVRRAHVGETVLIVGHSNTTPEVANLIARSSDLDRFSELDYGNLLIVTVPPTGESRVLKLRY